MTSHHSHDHTGLTAGAHPAPLVLGAAGFLGLNLVDHLTALGQRPLCAHRVRTNTLPLRRRGADRVLIELDDTDTLARTMEGRVVYHLAGHYPRDARTPHHTMSRALRELELVLDAAARAQVPRLVYVSSTATVAPHPDRASDESDIFTSRPDLGVYHDTKWLMEQRALAEDRLDVRVVCPGACLGPFDLRVGTSGLIIALANGMDPPHPDGVVNLVDVRDVAKTLAIIAHHPNPPRRLLVAGHDVFVHDFLEDLAVRFRVKRPSRPLSTAEAIAFADAEEARVAGTPDRARLAREIVDLIVHGTPLDTSLARSLIGEFTPLSDTLGAVESFARRLNLIPPPPLHHSGLR